jgi:hypothetical protein
MLSVITGRHPDNELERDDRSRKCREHRDHQARLKWLDDRRRCRARCPSAGDRRLLSLLRSSGVENAGSPVLLETLMPG